MRQGKQILILCMFFFCLVLQVHAEVRVYLQTETPRVGIGEDFFVQIRVEGLQQPGGDFELKKHQEFRIIKNGISRSQSVQIINGQMSKQMSFAMNYRLIPKKKGKFKLGPGIFEHKGKKYKTGLLEITVFTDPVNSGGRNRGGFFSFFNNAFPDPSWGGGGSDDAVEIKVEQVLLTNRAYANQEITLYLDIYASRPVINNVRLESITRRGFWEEEAKQNQQFRVEEIQKGNDRWYRYRRPAAYLYSIGSGERVLDGYHLRVFYRDPLPTSKIFKVAPIKMTIDPVPETGRIPGYKGDTGIFQLDVQEFPESARVGDAFIVKVALTGRGNVQSINELVPVRAGNYQISPIGNETLLTRKFDRIDGRRTFSYMVTPGKSGFQPLPGWKLAFFHSKTGKFTAVTTSSNAIMVLDASNSAPVSVNMTNALDAYIMTVSAKGNAPGLIFSKNIAFVLSLLSLLGAVSVVMMQHVKTVRGAHPEMEIKSQAYKTALRSLKSVRSVFRKNGSVSECAGLLWKIAVRLIMDKSGLPGGNPGIDRIRNLCRQGGVDSVQTDQLVAFISAMELVRYGGVQTDIPAEIRKLKKMIKTVNRQWVVDDDKSK